MNDFSTPSRASRRGRLVMFALVLAGVLGWSLTQVSAETKAGSGDLPEIAAEVAGEAIPMADVEVAAAAQLEQLELQKLQLLAQLEQQRTQALTESLDKLVEDRLLEAEAEARGVTVEELVATEIDGKLVEVSEDEVNAFYDERSSQGQRLPPREQVGPQIRRYLEQQRQGSVRGDFIKELRKKYSVKLFLDVPRAEVAVAGFPAKGPADAPVTIVEFSDFECPYCSRVVPTIEQLLETYGDKVRVVFRQFPLSIHANAQKAAEAALCAHDQGKFWEMHDLMFAEQRQLAVADLKDKAERLELDAETFASCLDGGTHADQVASDLREGAELGVSGTPALFVNGRFLSGAQPFEVVSKLVEDELARSATN